MSLSNLESQLASLHSKSGLPSSKKHHDSVGRGLHHSAKHGHAILNLNPKHKPSILHPDSRSAAAADTPLTTLRENAVLSLKFLQQHSSHLFGTSERKLSWSTLFGPKSVNYERGMSTSETNMKFDGFLKEALFLLSSALGDATGFVNNLQLASSIPLSTNIPSSVLHVMEYLVQKYFIHVYNSEDLLIAFLPHHETVLFERILQLVDLSQFPHWSFLRAYSVAAGVRGVPRSQIAKWAASTLDNGGGTVLIKALCDVGRRAAKIHAQEKIHSSRVLAHSSVEIRRGISIIISFSAAALTEALHFQCSASGTIDEATLRCLIPIILGAVEPHEDQWSLGALCPEWRSFGYIMISVVSGNSELSVDVCDTLATGMVKGSLEMSNYLRQDGNYGSHPKDSSESVVPSFTEIETASDTLLALMSIVFNKGAELESKERRFQSYLPLITTSKNRSNLTLYDYSKRSLGCNLSLTTFHELTNLSVLPAALGYLSEQKKVDVRSLLASLVAVCTTVIGKGGSKSIIEKCETCMVHLIKEASLRSLWLGKKNCLTVSIAAFVVKTLAHHSQLIDDSVSLAPFSKILNSIHEIDASGCDAGIGYTITSISSFSEPKAKAIASQNVKLLLESDYLKIEGNTLKDVEKSVQKQGVQFDNNYSSESGMMIDLDHILPPRVALEHPKDEVRSGAIKALVKDIDSNSELEKKGIAHLLLRRYISDDVASVATSAAKAVRMMLSNEVLSETFFAQSSIIEDFIIGLRKWSLSGKFLLMPRIERIARNIKKKSNVEHDQGVLRRHRRLVLEDTLGVVCESLKIAGLIANLMAKKQTISDYQYDVLTFHEHTEIIPEPLFMLVQEIVLHAFLGGEMNDEEDDVSCDLRDTALHSLLIAVDEDTNYDNTKNNVPKVLNNKLFLGMIRRCIGDVSTTCATPHNDEKKIKETILSREIFMHFFLNLSVEYHSELDKISLSTQFYTALALLDGLSKSTEKGDSVYGEASSIRTCLEKRATFSFMEQSLERSVMFIITLFSARSFAFVKISTPIIEVIWKGFQAKNNTFVLLLLEACSRPTSKVTGVLRMLAYLEKVLCDIDSECSKVIECSLVTTMGLLVHSEVSVREGALKLLQKIGSIIDKEGPLKIISGVCSLACELNSSIRGRILMDGVSALPELLRKARKSSENGSMLCKLLLKCCVSSFSAVNHFSSSHCNDFGIGFCNSTSLVLNAMESAGETIFPLLKRWEIAGKPLFTFFLECDWVQSAPSSIERLIESVVVMLKGVTIESGDVIKLKIATGPSGSGRRHRSYSFGKSTGISYIESYPNSMTDSIKDCLSTVSLSKKGQLAIKLCESANILVLQRPSWLKGIFPKLDTLTRKMIATSLLKLVTECSMQSAKVAFSSLTLDSAELSSLLSIDTAQGTCISTSRLLTLSLLADFVRGHAESLSNDRNVIDLSSALFKVIAQLSKTGIDGSDYTRSCFLHALCSLHNHSEIIGIGDTYSNRKGQSYSEQVGEHAQFIVSLLGAGDGSINPIRCSKTRSVCLALLKHLCSKSPSTVVDCLLPTIGTLNSTLNYDATLSIEKQLMLTANAAKDTLMTIVPVYCKYALGNGLTLFHLIDALVSASDLTSDLIVLPTNVERAVSSQNFQLLVYLIDSLVTALPSADIGIAIATILSVIIARMLFRNKANTLKVEGIEGQENIIDSISMLLSNINESHQIVAALYIVHYASKLINLLQNSVQSTESTDKESCGLLLLSVSELSHLGARGQIHDEGKLCERFTQRENTSLLWLVKSLLYIVRINIVSTSLIKQMIKSCVDKKAETCLRLWQALMVIQLNSSQQRQNATDVECWAMIESETSTSLALIQRLLPVPHFLASVSSIINDKDADIELQNKAVTLLGERSAETNAMTAEGALFMDMLPDLLKLISEKSMNDNECDYRRVSLLHQASCRAVDQLARNIGLVDDVVIMRRRATLFKPALQIVTKFLHSILHSKEEITPLILEKTQILSCFTLCASTLVTLLKAQSLEELPKLVETLITLLSSVNSHLESNVNIEAERKQGGKLIQLTVLRALIAVVETLPQFMVSSLNPLLQPSGLPSLTLRQDRNNDELAVKNMTERLDKTIVLLSPSWQLIPILTNAVTECFHKLAWREGAIIFEILKAAIDNSSLPNLGSMAGKITKALISAYEFECDSEVRFDVLAAANGSLISLVMKLSEAQLRQLYAKFREWRGKIDTSVISEASISRRQSFYSLSASMSKELRSIFLPCISSVVGDIADELEYAVSYMCATSTQSKKSKRRKLNDSSVPFDCNTIKTLQPLLLCLETALKADAHEGGNWIRGNDNERYKMLIGPLGKLLQAHVHSDTLSIINFDVFETSKPVSPYERLVQGVGTEDYGNVINCIISLAAAAGNEQLWKQLNHSLLEACGNEERAEVRKSGVKALLLIIQSLGEEYMVLLPEYLPILSELLEDDEDEEIIFLAKECIRHSEEFLGESLEDSLK